MCLGPHQLVKPSDQPSDPFVPTPGAKGGYGSRSLETYDPTSMWYYSERDGERREGSSRFSSLKISRSLSLFSLFLSLSLSVVGQTFWCRPFAHHQGKSGTRSTRRR